MKQRDQDFWPWSWQTNRTLYIPSNMCTHVYRGKWCPKCDSGMQHKTITLFEHNEKKREKHLTLYKIGRIIQTILLYTMSWCFEQHTYTYIQHLAIIIFFTYIRAWEREREGERWVRKGLIFKLTRRNGRINTNTTVTDLQTKSEHTSLYVHLDTYTCTLNITSTAETTNGYT